MQRSRTANLLGALAAEVCERVDARLTRHPNATHTAAAALKLVGEYEGCSNRDLSDALRLSHPATVRLVDRLEAAGLVTRGPGADRRSISLRLTPAGRDEVRARLDDRSAVLEALTAGLTDAQCADLDRIADTLLRSLVATPLDAAHVCRLCDGAACPAASCPVHDRAVRLAGAPA